MAQRRFLVKTEPEVFSIDDFERVKRTGWDCVRSFEARNTMRDLMQPGDLVLVYHSNAEPSGVAGLARVFAPPLPDPTQFDRKSEYFDATSPRDVPRWVMAQLEFVERFPAVLPLARLRAERALRGMPLLQKGQRLSVQKVPERHFEHVLALARTAGAQGAESPPQS